MKYLLFLFALILSPIFPLRAQTYISISEKIINADFSAFQPMADRDFPRMNEGILQARAGAKTYINKISLSAHLSYFYSEDDNAPKGKSAKFHGYGGSIAGQYHLWSWQTFSIRPTLEIGVRQYYLDYYEILPLDQLGIFSFFQGGNKSKAFSFTSWGLYEDIGITLEKRYSMKKGEFGFGFETGYRLDRGHWKLAEFPLSNSIANHNGLFFNINLLFSFHKRHKQK